TFEKETTKWRNPPSSTNLSGCMVALGWVCFGLGMCTIIDSRYSALRTPTYAFALAVAFLIAYSIVCSDASMESLNLLTGDAQGSEGEEARAASGLSAGRYTLLASSPLTRME
ncbi:hypothetical protein BHE74_00000336, partial [Ensete ventricosum]